MVSFEEIQAAYYMVAATGVLVAAVFYMLNLRISQRNQEISLKNQELMLKAQEQSAKTQQQNLETRQAQLFMNIYEKSSTKEFYLSWQKFTNARFSTFEEYRELFQRDKEFMEAYWALVSFYEGIGVLVREGLLPIRMVALLMSGPTRSYWEKFQTIFEEGKRVLGYSRWLSESEYLYGELMRYFKEHPEFDTQIEPLKDVPP